MKQLFAALMLLLLVLLVLSCGKEGTRITKATSLEEAKSLAAESGSLIVLDFYIDG